MNTYIKLFVLDADSEWIVIYGYSLPDANGVERTWSKGVIDKKLKLFRLTCSMNEKDFQIYKNSLLGNTNVSVCDKILKTGYYRRNTTLVYPKHEIYQKSSLIGKLCQCEEFWKLDKKELFDKIESVFEKKETNTRKYIQSMLDLISSEVGMDIVESAYGKIGNIEVYDVVSKDNRFTVDIINKSNDNDEENNVWGISVSADVDITEPFYVTCCLKNSDRIVLEEIKKISQTKRVEYHPQENFDEYIVKIWHENGALAEVFHESKICCIVNTIGVMGAKREISDTWLNKGKASIGNSPKQQEKLDLIQNISTRTDTLTTRSLDESNLLFKSMRQERSLIRKYIHGKDGGVFCKKIGTFGDEIDSFMAVKKLIDATNITKVILVDPYFSIDAIGKLLPRISNRELDLQIIVSLAKIDPDVDDNTSDDAYVDRIKEYLQRNKYSFHPKTKITNITHNGSTTIHDRYLLRFSDGQLLDGYLLSNSLNSAGQRYSYVIARMNNDVAYSVLEYVETITDEKLQNKKNKKERFAIDILWDGWVSREQRKIEIYRKDMVDKLEQNMHLNFNDIFYSEWDKTLKSQEEAIIGIGLRLCYSDCWKVKDVIKWIKANNIDENCFAEICKKVIVMLEEKEEEVCNSCDSHRADVYMQLKKIFRNQSSMNPKHFFNNQDQIFYKYTPYVHGLYKLLYEINPKKFIECMELSQSPMALCMLKKKADHDCCIRRINMELYKSLLQATTNWIRELGYYYVTEVVKFQIEHSNIELRELDDYLCMQQQIAAIQYACLLNMVTEEIHKVIIHHLRGSDRNAYLSNFSNAMDILIEKLNNCLPALDKNQSNNLLSYLFGNIDKVNCILFIKLIDKIRCNDARIQMARYMKGQLVIRWNDGKLYSGNGLCLTKCAAIACVEIYNTDIEQVVKDMKINPSIINRVLEPFVYDFDFDKWDTTAKVILWKWLFLLEYENLLRNNIKDCADCINYIYEIIGSFKKVRQLYNVHKFQIRYKNIVDAIEEKMTKFSDIRS